MNRQLNQAFQIFIILIILQLSQQLTEDINLTPQMYSSSYSQLSHSLHFQAPAEDIPSISDTAFTLWFRYNFYENQDINNLSHRSQSTYKHSHIAGIYNSYNSQCTQSRYHTVFYQLNLGTEFTLCNGGDSYTCSARGSNLINFEDLDSNWAFLYQSYSHQLKQVVTYVKIPSIDKIFFKIQTNVNNVNPMNSLHFVVGNCDPYYKFFGNIFNPRLYYKGDVHLGSQALIDTFYSSVIQPTLYKAKTDNFYYNFIGTEKVMSAYISEPLVEFSHYNEYAFYGWFKSNQSIPEVWFQLFRLTNWHLPQLTDITKCGDRNHAIFIRNGYYHHISSDCRLDSNTGDQINSNKDSYFSVSEINSWNWLYVGYQHTTKKYFLYIYYSSTGKTQTYSATQGKFRMNNPKFHITDTTFYTTQFNGSFKYWFIKLGPNSYKESNYTDMQNQTGCPTGTQLFNGNINACTQCETQCQTCSNKPDECDICKYSTNRTPPTCECDEGYTGSLTDSSCLKCESPCKTCKQLINNCMSCIDGYYLLNYTCIQCSYPCNNCTSDNDCLTCKTLQFRNSITDCSCQDTYYDNNTECVKCVYPCQNCSSNTICISCKTTANRKSVTDCECKEGYYDDNTQCQECVYPCSTCSSQTTCLSCKTLDNRISITNCGCTDGFYDNGISCTLCIYPCKNCENDKVCKSCKTPDNRNNETECVCNDTFYDNDSECVKCSYPCKNCTSDNDCLTCQTLPNRKSITDCGCQDTFYDNYTECIKCVYPCLNCTSDTICLSCKTTPNRKSLTDCLCEDGYFDDNTECLKCVYPCQNCSSLNTCLTCQTLDNRISTTNCGCIDGFYDNNSTCTQCLYPCLFCENSTVCKSCKTTENRKNNTECACNDTYYDNNTECIKCTYPCLNCTSDTVCLSCSTIDNRKSTTDCTCQDTYYDNNTECTKCVYPCINCTSSDICTSCVEDNNRSNIHPCKCNSGYFDNGSVCEKCHYKCKECQGSSDQCIDSCSDASRDFDKNCECLDGKFDEGVKLCGECSYKCQTCKTSADNCTLCKNGNGRSLVKAECTCQDTFFDDQQENIDCIECVHPCINCTTLTQCTSCVQRDNIDTETCLCLSGFYENTEKLCDKCSPQCQTCTSQPDNCDQCISGSNRQNKPSCLCEDGYFVNENQICEMCQYPCKKCVSKNECLECQTTDNRSPITNLDSNCSCQAGYFDNQSICQKCDIQCATCQLESHKCIQCSEETREGEFCDCKDSFYDIGNQACEKCNYKCGKCLTTSTNCTQCSEINRDENNNCNCKAGFYEDPSLKTCLPCQYPCENCENQFICTKCITINEELPQSRKTIPSCLCQNGYYENTETKKCEKCHNRCKLCSGNSENCTQCFAQIDREGLDKQCICKEQYYYPILDKDTNLEICKLCASNCKECDINGCNLCINPKAVPPNCEVILQENRDFLSFSVNIDGQNIQKTQLCDIQCSECQQSTDFCLKCSIGQNRMYNLPKCDCKEGFYSQVNTADCLSCPKFCKNCQSFNICTECNQNSNRILNKMSGSCDCSTGFKDVHGICVECFNYQGQCLQKCPINTIEDLTLKQCVNLNLVTNSKFNTIIISFGTVLVLLIISQLCFVKIMSKKLKNIQFNKLSQLKEKNEGDFQDISQIQNGESENVIKLNIEETNND